MLLSKTFKVVIDPGHGGNNSGVVFEDMIEKDYTLKVAKKINAFFKKYPNNSLKIIFLRLEDKNISLKKRAELIEKEKPDFFISIHFNSQSFLKSDRGMEIYYPKNNETLSSPDFFELYDRNNISFKIARFFKNNYFKTNIHIVWKLPFNLFTSKGNFAVFNKTKIPGILIECAYFSSPIDRACIKKDEFLGDIAWFIFDSIKKSQKLFNSKVDKVDSKNIKINLGDINEKN
jgi:N-acetylmuramoyl-L-alanine amidase